MRNELNSIYDGVHELQFYSLIREYQKLIRKLKEGCKPLPYNLKYIDINELYISCYFLGGEMYTRFFFGENQFRKWDFYFLAFFTALSNLSFISSSFWL